MRETMSRDVPVRASLLERREIIPVRGRGRTRRMAATTIPGAVTAPAAAHGLTLDALAGVVGQLLAAGHPGDTPLVAGVAPSPFAPEGGESQIVSIMAVTPAAVEAAAEEPKDDLFVAGEGTTLIPDPACSVGCRDRVNCDPLPYCVRSTPLEETTQS